MQAKSVVYAAVGAPIVAARKVSHQVSTLREKISTETSNYGEAAEKAINSWASEGEKVVSRISQGRVVEEISAKVDLDQAKEQVSKLRDQLEDMLETWHTSFRPEKTEGGEAPPAEAKKPKAPAAKKPTPKPSADKPASDKPATKTSAAKTTKSSAAAKTSSTKPASASEAEKAS